MRRKINSPTLFYYSISRRLEINCIHHVLLSGVSDTSTSMTRYNVSQNKGSPKKKILQIFCHFLRIKLL